MLFKILTIKAFILCSFFMFGWGELTIRVINNFFLFDDQADMRIRLI